MMAYCLCRCSNQVQDNEIKNKWNIYWDPEPPGIKLHEGGNMEFADSLIVFKTGSYPEAHQPCLLSLYPALEGKCRRMTAIKTIK